MLLRGLLTAEVDAIRVALVVLGALLLIGDIVRCAGAAKRSSTGWREAGLWGRSLEAMLNSIIDANVVI